MLTNRLSAKLLLTAAVQEPAWYCDKRLWVQASFKEQAGEGFQECYTATEDMTNLLMPGALRLLGMIPMYPEDPKADYLNGEIVRLGEQVGKTAPINSELTRIVLDMAQQRESPGRYTPVELYELLGLVNDADHR